MKRFLAMFELTVAEQRVVIFLLLALVAFAALMSRRDTGGNEVVNSTTPAASDQPSPSPGTGP